MGKLLQRSHPLNCVGIQGKEEGGGASRLWILMKQAIARGRKREMDKKKLKRMNMRTFFVAFVHHWEIEYR